MINVSLFASSVRPQLYESLFESLKDTTVSVEVVFAGNKKPNIDEMIWLVDYAKFKYIETKNIKPSQCYEIARRECKGEVVVWIADDCEFPNDVIGKAYRYWKSQENEKLILSIQTKESGYPRGGMYLFNMKDHTFFGYDRKSPLMAPLAMMSRTYLDKLGGVDKRYTCGQYENSTVMQAYADGGKVEIFGDENCCIEIDHWTKSKLCNEGSFLHRPFATGYEHDRKILESSWVKDNKITMERNDDFQPFDDKDILIKSQSHKGQWE